MDISNLGTIVAIIVGVYGIIHATFLVVRENLKERRKLIVYCEKTVEKWSKPTQEEISRSLVFMRSDPNYDAITIQVINNGNRPISVVSCGFDLSNGEKIQVAAKEVDLPRKIEVGEIISIPVWVESLRSELEYRDTKPRKIFKKLKSIRSINALKNIGSLIRHIRIGLPIYIDYVIEPDTEEE